MSLAISSSEDRLSKWAVSLYRQGQDHRFGQQATSALGSPAYVLEIDRRSAVHPEQAQDQAASSARQGTEGTDAKSSQPAKEASQRSGSTYGARYDQIKLQQETGQLRATENKVRQHEAAHKTAGGRYTGAIQYEYQQGPDGKRYIVGGEVSIDLAEERTPEATIQKMEQVRRAALAPADPSPQDNFVASQAAMKAADARRKLAEQENVFYKVPPSGQPLPDNVDIFA